MQDIEAISALIMHHVVDYIARETEEIEGFSRISSIKIVVEDWYDDLDETVQWTVGMSGPDLQKEILRRKTKDINSGLIN